MISTATALTTAWASRGSGPQQARHDKGADRNRDHGRHKPAGNDIRQSLYRGARALCFTDHLHDLRKQGVTADFLGAHQQAAGAVDGGADDGVTRGFFTEMASPLTMDSSTALLPSGDDAVHRDFFAGAYAQHVTGLHLFAAEYRFHCHPRERCVRGRARAPLTA